DRAFQNLLHRPVDPVGLTAWTGLLEQGGSRADVARGIEASPEYQGDVVQEQYQLLLHRPAEEGGLEFHTALLASGGTVEQLQADIAGSEEYFANRAGQSNNAFLDALYQ